MIDSIIYIHFLDAVRSARTSRGEGKNVHQAFRNRLSEPCGAILPEQPNDTFLVYEPIVSQGTDLVPTPQIHVCKSVSPPEKCCGVANDRMMEERFAKVDQRCCPVCRERR
jgi:hypothetical protein